MGDTTHQPELPTVPLPAGPASTPARPAPAAGQAGDFIGPFRLLEVIGEGGFGVVWAAERREPMVQRVALKIIKPGMDSKAVVARFEQERQALAVMDHPSIARVLDAGVTDAGRPYFVMDLVKGEPISEFCDRNTLPINERLDLFSQVCAAVQHAHSKGIIHRDLKPSNIIVSSLDARPTARVIDFGIAKAIGGRLTGATLYTEQGQLIGTPEYMSPEQAEGSSDIDIRSDVYSLGVLLYELLTGTTPFSSQELRSATHAEIQRIIREKDPPKPSTRLSQATTTISQVAAKRRTDPRRLGTMIRGELDWIAMKAMEKDRARRYETANALAMDLRRYLSGEPVLAAPPSTAYRVRKFARRHRGAVTAAAVALIALVLGVVGTSVGMLQARHERGIAQANAERAAQAEGVAHSRLAEAEATVTFLDQMLGAADPTAEGKDVTVRRVLDKAAKSVGERFADRPLVAARLHGTIGRTYVGLGDFDPADTHLREQLRLRTAQLGPDHEDTRRAANDLAVVLIRGGHHAEAESFLKEAIVTDERLFGRRHAVTLQALDLLASLYVDQTRGPEAEPILREVLDAHRSMLGPAAPETLSSMNALATLYADSERFDESEKLFEEAARILLETSGPEHPNTLEVQSNLAWMQYWAASAVRTSDPEQYQRRLQRARALGEQTLDARKRVLGEEHRETLATMSNLASVYKDLGMLDEAEALKRKDLDVCLRTLGEDHPDTIISLGNLGALLRSRGKCEEAVAYFVRSLEAMRRTRAPESQGLAFTLGWYGSCLTSLARYAEGETALTEAFAVIVRALGEGSPIARDMGRDIVTLYQAWDNAQPDRGHGAKAAEWKAKLEALEKREAKQDAPGPR